MVLLSDESWVGPILHIVIIAVIIKMIIFMLIIKKIIGVAGMIIRRVNTQTCHRPLLLMMLLLPLLLLMSMTRLLKGSMTEMRSWLLHVVTLLTMTISLNSRSTRNWSLYVVYGLTMLLVSLWCFELFITEFVEHEVTLLSLTLLTDQTVLRMIMFWICLTRLTLQLFELTWRWLNHLNHTNSSTALTRLYLIWTLLHWQWIKLENCLLETLVDTWSLFSLRIFIGSLVRVNSIVCDDVSPLWFDYQISSMMFPCYHQGFVLSGWLGEGWWYRW